MAEATLAILIFGPLAITYFLKSNAALGFLALCVGFVLSTSVIGDLKHLLSETHLSVSDQTLGLVLVVLPLIITLLITRSHTHRQGIGLIVQLVVAVCAGGLLALTLGPLLTDSSQFNITNSGMWKDLSKAQAGIIGTGSLLSLVAIWSHGFRNHKKH